MVGRGEGDSGICVSLQIPKQTIRQFTTSRG